MTKSPRWSFLAAVMFFLIGLFLLTTVQPVWWSIVSVVIVLSASAASLIRGIVDVRSAKRGLTGP